MGKKVTIGGNRVGSGKKMKAELNNYYRSTHNLSEKWASSMGCGILYPAMVKLGMRGDSFDIKINADCRTIPTKGPLFGSYKMQIDVYQCPIRLYQGILHNNPLAIGLKMSQVKLPQIHVYTNGGDLGDQYAGQFNNSCLLKYLGFSGIGVRGKLSNEVLGRNINALPALSYYDIFKTYYANKQEEKAYVITADESASTTLSQIEKITYGLNTYTPAGGQTDITISNLRTQYFIIEGKDLNTNIKLSLSRGGTDIYEDETLENLSSNSDINLVYISKERIEFTAYNNVEENDLLTLIDGQGYIADKLQLIPFDLSNIDDMRYDLLSSNRLGDTFLIEHDTAYLPYKALVDDIEGVSKNKYPLNGLVLKTYQNDIFNNWLNAEWIEGENGINEMTKVEIVDGAFSMDALNFAQKLYNMLNRIAVAGATYEDWQDVVYEEVNRRQIESPIYVGGMSQEVVFDEVIQTAPADGDPLGALGGRGRLNGRQKGGGIHVKCDEACFIIAIVSLTPRIFQTQGNEFYMTELQSLDDIHKPALDGIGFQDLIGERLAWWDTIIKNDPGTLQRSAVGKLPAWIEYMTSYDRAFGDFAEEDGKGYMILNRNYERDEENGGIKDVTTYIDPSKYNYAFAYTELDAQNFWVEIGFEIRARRLMSARLIPSV